MKSRMKSPAFRRVRTFILWLACEDLRFARVEVDMVDEIFSQEDQEVEELVSWMQRAEGNENGELARQSMSDYGSDDEEYDRLFTDVMTEVHEQKANDAETDSGQALDMDMSLG